MTSSIKGSIRRRFSSKTAHETTQDSGSRFSTNAKEALAVALRALAPSSSAPQVQTASATSSTPRKAVVVDDDESPKLRSITKATIPPPSTPIKPSLPQPPRALSSDEILDTPTRPIFHQNNSPYPSSRYEALGSHPPTANVKDFNRLTNGVTIVDCGPPSRSPRPRSFAAESTLQCRRPAMSPPSMLERTVQIPFNPALPAYVLDRIHPCLPLPANWDWEHDQYIVSLDVQDYHTPAMIRRLKQRFPELRAECITPGMVDRRLKILDLRVDWPGWKRAISTMPPTGHVDDFDSGFDARSSKFDTSSVPKPNNAKKLLANVANRTKTYRRISTGGMSSKITIDKGGTSVTSLSVDPLRPADAKPPVTRPTTYLRSHSTSSGSTHTSSLTLKGYDSSRATTSTSWTTGASPSSLRSKRLTLPEKAAAQLLQTKVHDFAPGPSYSSTPMPSVIKASLSQCGEKEWWIGYSEERLSGTGGSVAGDEVVKAVDDVNQRRHIVDGKGKAVIGVPSVMRTSSGKPVLR